MPTVAFIGLGNMGGPMAKNLLKADWAVTAFDLSESALSDVVAAGAVAAPRSRCHFVPMWSSRCCPQANTSSRLCSAIQAFFLVCPGEPLY